MTVSKGRLWIKTMLYEQFIIQDGVDNRIQIRTPRTIEKDPFHPNPILKSVQFRELQVSHTQARNLNVHRNG